MRAAFSIKWFVSGFLEFAIFFLFSAVYSQELEFVGQLGGTVQAVAAQDETAFIGCGSYLTVLQSLNTWPFQRRGTLPLPADITALAVQDGYVYAALTSQQLALIDATDPDALKLQWIAPMATYGLDISVSGPLVIVAMGAIGAQAFTDFHHTSLIPGAVFNMPDEAEDIRAVAASGTLALLADLNAGVRIVDFSNPHNPVPRGHYNSAMLARNVVSQESIGFAAGAAGLHIFDFSDPDEPFQRHLDPLDLRFISLFDDILYGLEANTLRVIDVTDPDNPFPRGMLYNPDFLDCRDFSASQSSALLAVNRLGCLTVNAENPDSPTPGVPFFTPHNVIDLSVSGNRAHLAEDRGLVCPLVVIDMEKPTAPWVRNSTSGIPSMIRFVSTGNNIFAVGENLGVHDIQQEPPDLIKSVDALDLNQDIQSDGLFCYAVSEDSMKVFDVQTPADAYFRSSYSNGTDQDYFRLDQSGSVVCVAAKDSGLLVFDLADPADPLLRSSFETPGTALDVNTSATFAYVADDTHGLQIIDISNPGAPFIRGNYDTPGYAKSLALSGHIACVADSSSLQIIDVSDPDAPVFRGSIPFPASDVSVFGDLVFFVDTAFGTLYMADIANPGTPYVRTGYGGMYPSFVAGANGRVYIADSDSNLVIFEWSYPNHLDLVGELPMDDTIRDIAAMGDYVFLALEHHGLQIVDTSDADAPVVHGAYDCVSTTSGIWVSGNRGLAGGTAGLYVFDLEDPSDPTVLGRFDITPFDGRSLDIRQDRAYVACGNNGLQRFDISNPDSIERIETIDLPGDALVSRIGGELLFVGHTEGLVRLFDISNPDAPEYLSEVNLNSPVRDVVLDGTLAHMATTKGIETLDVSDPAHPVWLAAYNTPGVSYNLFVQNSLLYVADGIQGLLVLQFNPDARNAARTWRMYSH